MRAVVAKRNDDRGGAPSRCAGLGMDAAGGMASPPSVARRSDCLARGYSAGPAERTHRRRSPARRAARLWLVAIREIVSEDQSGRLGALTSCGLPGAPDDRRARREAPGRGPRLARDRWRAARSARVG